MTPEQRHLRAQIGAYAKHARHDPRVAAERGQAGLVARFETEIAAEFPDLDPAELHRRAEARYQEHMKRLAYRSATSRREKRTRKAGTP